MPSYAIRDKLTGRYYTEMGRHGPVFACERPENAKRFGHLDTARKELHLSWVFEFAEIVEFKPERTFVWSRGRGRKRR